MGKSCSGMWSPLVSSFSLTPREALEHELRCRVDPALNYGAELYSPDLISYWLCLPLMFGVERTSQMRQLCWLGQSSRERPG